jgi:hypothetical protein
VDPCSGFSGLVGYPTLSATLSHAAGSAWTGYSGTDCDEAFAWSAIGDLIRTGGRAAPAARPRAGAGRAPAGGGTA